MSQTNHATPAAAASWRGAVVRACHPARWTLCLVGLVVSALVGALALAVFEGGPPRPGAWWRDPLAELDRLGGQLFGLGSGTAVLRCLPLAAVLSVVWGPVAGWIARSELLRQRAAGGPGQTTANLFVLQRTPRLNGLLLPTLFLTGFAVVPALLAGLINRVLGLGSGAVLVSLVWPVVLLTSLMLALMVIGGLSYAIMPAALAAEGSDIFDALSRGYSYVLQRPVQFGVWWGFALVISAVPSAGVLWLQHTQPNLLRPETAWWLWAAASWSLSLFWTLQGLVYLKMRRLVDETPETEIWDSAPDDWGKTQAGARLTNQEAGTPAADAGPALLRSKPFTWEDTLHAGRAGDLVKLAALFFGVLGTALILAAGGLAAWQLDAAAGQALSAAGVRAAVVNLAGQRPGVFLGLVTAVFLLGALALGGMLKRVARLVAVRAVYGRKIPLRAVWSFPRRTRGQGLAGVLLATAGVELLLVTGFLLSLAMQDVGSWGEVASFGGWACGLLGLGALGLGVVAVEGQRPEETRVGSVFDYFGNGLETLTSAVANLGLGLVRSAVVVGLAWLSWLIACETIAWWGGANVQWLRWGLDGSLRPQAEGGLYGLASWVAGLWFFLWFGLALMYPLSNAVRWGAACYLLARQKRDDAPPEALELSAEERAALDARPKKREVGVSPPGGGAPPTA